MATYLCGLVYLKNKHKKQKRSVSNAALFNAGRRKRPRSYIIVQQFTFSYEPIANSGGLGLPLEIRVSLARRPSSRNKYPAYRKELNNWRKKLRLLPAGAMFT